MFDSPRFLFDPSLIDLNQIVQSSVTYSSWQKLVLDQKKWFPRNDQAEELINDLYQRYPGGFYVDAETKMKYAKGAAKYIGRYLARPEEDEYRITSYDGQTVRFWYEDHRTGTTKRCGMACL
ncbi:transposase [Salipaludibacillus sp. CF4.18]|uniref:transposase n=1 Tax=Salipaludibacillus sp. CF4.18 TaxID=3373081 RepID=UPI003EE484EF